MFANILLVDEINRASPKTQAALLECMQERQVTIDGVSYQLAPPFMVMATQNPIEYEGTYPLPEAELDRFTMRIAIGYPPLADEARMLSENAADTPLDSLECVASAQEVLGAIESAKNVFVEESLNRYVVAVLRHTRSDSRLFLGASPRAGLALLRVAKARALVAGRDFVEPDDVKIGRADRARPPADPLAGGPRGRPRRRRARPGHHRAHAGPRLGPARDFVLTDRGRWILALGGGIYLAAWALGSQVLYPVAIGLVLAVLAAALWVRLLQRPMTLRRTLGRGERLAGDDVPVQLELDADGLIPSGTLVLRETVARLGERETPLVRKHGRLRGRYVLRRVPRGRYPIEETEVVIEDPFGLERIDGRRCRRARRSSSTRGSSTSTGSSRSPARARPEGRRLLMRRPTGFDLHSVRDYQQGESLRRVHWPTTARRGHLMVKELEDSPRDETAVLLDADAAVGRRRRARLELRAGGARRRLDRQVAREPRAACGAHRQRAAPALPARALLRRRLAPGARDPRRGRAGRARAPSRTCSPTRPGPASRAVELTVVTSALSPRLVDRLAHRALGNHAASLVYVDAASFAQAGRRAPPGRRAAQLLRLQRAGVPVLVLRRGDDLAAAPVRRGAAGRWLGAGSSSRSSPSS